MLYISSEMSKTTEEMISVYFCSFDPCGSDIFLTVDMFDVRKLLSKGSDYEYSSGNSTITMHFGKLIIFSFRRRLLKHAVFPLNL